MGVSKRVKVTQRDIPTLPDGTYFLEKGLYLRKRDGYGSFFFRVQVEGKRHDIGFGSVKDISLAVAKAKAVKLRAMIADGERPWEKDGQRDRVLFKDFWEEAFNTFASTQNWKVPRSYDKSREHTLRALIVKRALPKIGNVALADIDRDVILDLLTEMWSAQPVTANRLRFVLGKLFGIAIVKGLMKYDPTVWEGNLSLFLPKIGKVSKVKHHSALTFDETRNLLTYLMPSSAVAHRALILLIVTVRRLSEALYAKWEDFDLDEGVWTIPDDNMKVSRDQERRVPLPHQLVSLMRTWPKSGEYVFSSNGTNPIGRAIPLVAVKRQSKKDATVHGFRSTFIDWCAENQVPVDVAERCLDHESGSRVRQAYFRSDLFDLRKDVLQRYADALFGVE